MIGEDGGVGDAVMLVSVARLRGGYHKKTKKGKEPRNLHPRAGVTFGDSADEFAGPAEEHGDFAV